jgi:hypothetical protein
MRGQRGQQNFHWSRWYIQAIGSLGRRERADLEQFEDLELVSDEQSEAAKVTIQNLQDGILTAGSVCCFQRSLPFCLPALGLKEKIAQNQRSFAGEVKLLLPCPWGLHP